MSSPVLLTEEQRRALEVYAMELTDLRPTPARATPSPSPPSFRRDK